jgi:6-phosphogluconolactonase
MKIQVFKDAEAVSQAAAGRFVQLAKQAIASQDYFTVALSGGSTPKRVHELLAQAPYRDEVDWKKVHVFWGDERCVPLSDPQSNAKMAFDTLLNHVPIPREQIYIMVGDIDPAESAAQYEALLKKQFPDRVPVFDLIFLGMGDDGHTASLFPGTQALQEKAHWVKENWVEKLNTYRITLTAPVINQADAILFLVAGAGKAQVLHEVLEGPHHPELLPSQLIRPSNSEAVWLIDEAAAAQLKAIRNE